MAASEASQTRVPNAKKTHQMDWQVVAKPGGGGTLLKRRWVVERTGAWGINVHRQARDYAVLIRPSEAWI